MTEPSLGERDRLAALLQEGIREHRIITDLAAWLIAAGVTLREPGAPITEVSREAVLALIADWRGAAKIRRGIRSSRPHVEGEEGAIAFHLDHCAEQLERALATAPLPDTAGDPLRTAFKALSEALHGVTIYGVMPAGQERDPSSGYVRALREGEQQPPPPPEVEALQLALHRMHVAVHAASAPLPDSARNQHPVAWKCRRCGNVQREPSARFCMNCRRIGGEDAAVFEPVTAAELLAWYGTEQSMHAAWRKRAEECEATAPLGERNTPQTEGDPHEERCDG